MKEALGELTETYWGSYVGMALIFGVAVFCIIGNVFYKSKDIYNKFLKLILRISASTIILFVWAYFIIYKEFSSVYFAHQDYKNSLYNETTGVIESIERDSRDQLIFVIDGAEYKMFYSTEKHHLISKFDEGDVVKIEYGKKSKYIFDMTELDKSP